MSTHDLAPDRRAALLVAIPALLMAAAVLHHPTLHVAHDAPADAVAAGVARIAVANAAFHALVLALVGAQAIGICTVAQRLGLERLAVRAGAFAYAMATVLLFVAAIVDGFMTPLLASPMRGGCVGDAATCATAFAASIGVEFAMIQAFTKVGLVVQALGLSCWSLVVARTHAGTLRAVAICGCVIALVPLLVLARLDGPIGPVALVALVAPGGAWSVGVAIALWRGVLARPARTLTVD